MVTGMSVDGENDRRELFIEMVVSLGNRMTALEERIAEIHEIVLTQRVEKEWYSTTELAEALGKSPFTIRERWCNAGRIECEKDPETDKWRIPGEEYRRLVGGGKLRPKRR
jgi:hypothetical protein